MDSFAVLQVRRGFGVSKLFPVESKRENSIEVVREKRKWSK